MGKVVYIVTRNGKAFSVGMRSDCIDEDIMKFVHTIDIICCVKKYEVYNYF